MRLAFVTLALVALAALAVSATAVDLETEAPGQTTTSQSESERARWRKHDGESMAVMSHRADEYSARATDTIAGSGWLHNRRSAEDESAGQSVASARPVLCSAASSRLAGHCLRWIHSATPRVQLRGVELRSLLSSPGALRGLRRPVFGIARSPCSVAF